MNIVVPSCVHDGIGYVAMTTDTLAAVGVPPAVVLDAVRPILKQRIDTAAEAARLSLITPGAGQALEYQEASIQARAALADSAPTEAKYPMLAASVGVDRDPQTGLPATDVAGVARGIVAAQDLWLVIGAEIRGLRLRAKLAISEASTLAEAETAIAVAWPTGPL